MLTKSYGKTGKEVSIIGFGGMRFSNPKDLQESADLILYAHSKGINYFDTAPVYCEDRSEEIMGTALSQLPRDSYHISTKCSRHTAEELREHLERSLDRLKVESIDFFHIWHLINPADWQGRLKGGAVEEAIRAKEEGLIRHLVCSSHMQGDELVPVLDKGIFEGVLLGYNVLNFPYRSAAVELAGKQNLGVVTMNPLGGGLIPQNQERFAFLCDDRAQDVVSAALRFNVSNPHVTSALVGFSNMSEVDQAVAAVKDIEPIAPKQLAAIKEEIEASFNELCTGCGYCLPCPVDIPIPKYLDAYNHILLKHGDRKAALDRLKWHWNFTGEKAKDCIKCGQCEERCTQHLPIMQRLADLPIRTPEKSSS